MYKKYGDHPNNFQFPKTANFLDFLGRKCSFQKESVVCGRRIGIRKGSGDIVYYPRHEDPSYSLSCPKNRQEKNNNSEYWYPVEEHRWIDWMLSRTRAAIFLECSDV